jgi:hypothetical protein
MLTYSYCSDTFGQQEGKSNLIVKLTDIRRADLTAAWPPVGTQLLPICDRCHNLEETVVATMQVLSLKEPGRYAAPACASCPPVSIWPRSEPCGRQPAMRSKRDAWQADVRIVLVRILPEATSAAAVL